MWKAIGLLVLIPALGLAQRPEVYPGGVVNAATLAPLGQWHGIAPGSIFTIFGRNLATSTEAARSVPLPTKLGGAEVLVSGKPVPVFYASPTQINVQMPNGLLGGALSSPPKELLVRTSAGTSEPTLVPLVPHGLGIFTLDASGCGRGTVFNVGPDGSLSLNSPDDPIPPGGILTIFGTGLGETRPPAPTGEPAPLDGLLRPNYDTGAMYPYVDSGTAPGRILYAGRAPGLIGVDQMNLQLAESAVEGCGVPLRLTSRYSQSQPVPISVGRGGTCPPLPSPDAFGAITLRRVETVSATSTTVTEELVVDLSAAIAKQRPRDPLTLTGGCGGPTGEFTSVPRGPSCPGFDDFYGKLLDAGAITLSGPGFQPMRFLPSLERGRPVYRAPLPLGTIRPGEFTVTAGGGRDVGAFQSSFRVLTPVEVTSDFPPGSRISSFENFRLTWRGGDPEAVVQVRLISRLGPFEDLFDQCVVKASAGGVTIPSSRPWYLHLPSSDNAEVRITVGSEGDQVQRFAAPGLSLGGAVYWLYQKRFTELKLQ